MLNRDKLAGLFRYALYGLGVCLASRGYLTDADLEDFRGNVPEIAEALTTFLLIVGPPVYFACREWIRARLARLFGRQP